MKTKQEYIDSLKELDPEIYFMGERINDVVNNAHFKPHINSAAETYKVAFNPETKELGTAISHLTGKRINRFTHIHQSNDDLIKKVKLLRYLGQKTGTCFQRCVGFDALNAVNSVTYEMDEKLGTNYFERFTNYLKYVQENDLMVGGAMTDAKGDRSKRPSEQNNPDAFVRIVDENKDGIIVRGAKAHHTGLVNSHEMLIMPTVNMKEADKDYSVSFAIPVDTDGVKHIFGRQTNDMRRKEDGDMDTGNAKYGIVGGEALTIFDDVFVPWERVFMCREYEFSGMLVYRFATYHRQNYGACKTGVSDVIIGASASAAEYNGVEKASHIQDKLAEMLHLTETLYTGSIACSAEGIELPSGQYFADPLMANVVKHNITRFIYEIYRISHDIAGGYIATIPSEKDFKHKEIGKYLEKYMQGISEVPAEDRMRIGRLIENMTGGTAQVEAMHGAGSPMAQRITYLRSGNLEFKKELARKLAGIKNNEKD